MQIHRSEVDLLTIWLNKKGRKPLIIHGARQVGKSTLVRQLASLSQRICFELNFERYPEHADFLKAKIPLLFWAWINRGSLAEQFIGQTLLQLHPSYQMPELYYWLREQVQSSAEVDYLWQHENRIIPIEVKAGKTGRLKSLHYFIQEKHWAYALRFNTDTPSLLDERIKLPYHEKFSYQLLSLPFYLAGQTNRFISELLY